MVMKALNRKLWRDLKSLRSQTTTMAILIICGVALLVATWSAYHSLRAARDSYYREYSFADIFAECKLFSIYTLSKIRAIPGVQFAEARISVEGLVNVAERNEPAVGRFLSLPSSGQPQLNRLHLRKGRLPVDRHEVEVVVHEGFSEAHHLNPGDKLLITIGGQQEEVRVVGIALSPEFVYALSPAAPLPDDLHFGVFWMTESRLQNMAKLGASYNSVLIKLGKAASKPAVIAALDQILKPFGSLGAYARDRQSSNRLVEDEIAEQKVSAFFIPAVFLGIATFLVNIIASRLIALHRSQIAALKSLGYTRWEVSLHYLELVLAMTLMGTIPGLLLGAVLGSWMSKTYESYFRFPELDFSISTSAAFIGFLAGMMPGPLGAWSSIRAAFNLAPAEAMRPLAPQIFRASFFEKSNLQGRLPIRQRMILRNILAKPFRLFLLIFSLSAALGIVITASSWGDMIEYLLQSQFNRLQREDLSISLNRPQSRNALQEIAAIPGVVAAEGFRVVPIRITFMNHQREITLTGWPKNAAMRQLLDSSLHMIPLPDRGLLLSRFFAKDWGVRPGDTVQVTPLEGQQKSLLVPVVGFTDELIGINASMKIEFLSNLLGEEASYNLITLKVDPHKKEEVYVRLRSYPEVISVNLKQALYEGFRSTFGQVIRTSTLVLMVAALLIAIGIIYNSVRVSFSERSWELASMRILGFEQSAVSAVLLAEIGVQVGLSLGPGCLLGWSLTHLSMRLIHTEAFGFPVIIQWSTYASGLFTIIMAFLGSAWIAKRMIARIQPVEALKSRE